MAEGILRLFYRVSRAVGLSLLQRVGARTDALAGLQGQPYRRAATKLISDEADATRMQLEAIAGKITAFAERTELAEIALRAACHDHAELMDILDGDSSEFQSPEDRALQVLLEKPKLFDRASSIAAGHHWRGSRQDCAFRIPGGGDVSERLDETVEAIRRAVQDRQGGRMSTAERKCIGRAE